jgi:hypothetical protein
VGAARMPSNIDMPNMTAVERTWTLASSHGISSPLYQICCDAAIDMARLTLSCCRDASVRARRPSAAAAATGRDQVRAASMAGRERYGRQREVQAPSAAAAAASLAAAVTGGADAQVCHTRSAHSGRRRPRRTVRQPIQ